MAWSQKSVAVPQIFSFHRADGADGGKFKSIGDGDLRSLAASSNGVRSPFSRSWKSFPSTAGDRDRESPRSGEADVGVGIGSNTILYGIKKIVVRVF